VFSVALESPHIEVEFDTAPSGTRTIMIEGVQAAEIDTDPNLNAAGKALSALASSFGKPDGYVLRMKGEILPGKGRVPRPLEPFSARIENSNWGLVVSSWFR
jgi:hypothetical protein